MDSDRTRCSTPDLCIEIGAAKVHVAAHVLDRTGPLALTISCGLFAAFHVRPARSECNCAALHPLTLISAFSIVRLVFTNEVEPVQIRRLELVGRIVPWEDRLVIVVKTDAPGFTVGFEGTARLSVGAPVVIFSDISKRVVRFQPLSDEMEVAVELVALEPQKLAGGHRDHPSLQARSERDRCI